MQLEDWVKKDMTRFIKEHEPEIAKSMPVRDEDMGTIAKIDYERHVKRALDQHRFKEATKHFNELKEQFVNIPPEHAQERKQYYRILQKCYKLIYDYVEDRHKTSRLLDRLDDSADVFDNSIQSVDLKEQSDQKLVMPSIEEMMFRKKKQLPKFNETNTVSLPEAPKEPQAGEEGFKFKTAQQGKQEQQDVSNVSMKKPEAPKSTSSHTSPSQQNTSVKDAFRMEMPNFKGISKKEKQSLPQTKSTEHKKPPVEKKPSSAPKWTPPKIDSSLQPRKRHEAYTMKLPNFSNIAAKKENIPALKQPTESVFRKQPATNDTTQNKKFADDVLRRELHTDSSHPHATQKLATTELIRHAASALKKEDFDTAKTKLIEARVEYMRSNEEDPQQLRDIQALERQITTKTTKPFNVPVDAEVFSTLYLRAMHAMKEKNYQEAANLFAKRIDQAPHDVAAKIRYKECTEALHGQTA